MLQLFQRAHVRELSATAFKAVPTGLDYVHMVGPTGLDVSAWTFIPTGPLKPRKVEITYLCA